MKYYFVSYAHSKGMGSTTFKCRQFLDIKQARLTLIERIRDENLIIINFIKITKKQFDCGI